ncbi:MAG: hypothetical protein EA378_00245 [Phycisphaerales bacterium]|nr:MAG: hypothetical protein EA378_00245 [Phycisphaerales bacterium]
MEMAMAVARQNPAQAFDQLANWATRRLSVPLEADEIRRTPPAKIRDRLLEGSKKFVDDGVLEATIQEAIAQPDDEALEAMLRKKFGNGVPESMRWLVGQERNDAVRAHIENLMRSELLYFERTILIETFDTSWKDHLYGMDQLRDGISFRAFSQQDPRIAFKREGSRLFKTMLQTVRERVTDYVFRARIGPAPSAAPMPPRSAAPQGAPMRTGAGGAGMPPARQGGGGATARPQGSATASGLPGLAMPGMPVSGGLYEPPKRPAPPADAGTATDASQGVQEDGAASDDDAPSADPQSQVDAARAALDADRGSKRTR